MLKKIGLSFLTLVLVMSMSFSGLAMAEEAAQPTTTQEATTTTSTENTEATQTTENSTENTTEEGTTENTEGTETEGTETEATESNESTEGTETSTETEATEGEDAATDDETTEQEPAAEAGITPDSLFYSFDRLMEQVQLLLTFTQDAKVELLAKLADERLAEAEVMTDAEKVALAQQALNDFADTLNAVVQNVEATSANVTDQAEVDAAVASLELFRAGLEERFEALIVTLDQKIAEAEAAEQAEEGTEESEEGTEEEAEEAVEETEDEGPVHLKNAIILVYNLPEDTFEVLMGERGMNFGQAKMVAILMGKLQAQKATEVTAEETEDATTDETGAEATEVDQTEALNSLINEVMGMKTKGWGQVKKQLGLKGQAVGHILKQAGLVDAEEAEAIADAETEVEEDEATVATQSPSKGNSGKGADKGRGKGRGGK